MPLEWVTNYEKLYVDTSPVQSQDLQFQRQTDGSVKTTFQLPQRSSDDTPPIFQSMMITPVAFEEDIPVHAFHPDGSVVYTDKINGHFIWDIDPNMCDDHCSCKWKKKPKTSCSQSKQPFKPGDPDSPWIAIHLANLLMFMKKLFVFSKKNASFH
ncbi:hypothetical protein ACOSQ4_012257 [Xanthoceras sorbifolium]